MKTYNAGEMVVAGIVGAVLAIGTVQAGTVLWYRFDGNGATIENKASPGTMDGTLKSINTWGSLGGLGDTAAKFPTRGDAFPEGTRLIDPATDTIHSDTVKSLSFSGDPANSGTVRLLKADTTAELKEMMSCTCEVFFKLPSDSAAIETRRAKDILFPLVDWGSPDGGGRGWFLGLRKDDSTTGFYPFFRYKYDNGTSVVQGDCQDKRYLTDDKWHHLAVIITADTSANTATVKLVLDYTTLAATKTLDGFRGFHNNNTGNFPFLVGADLWRSSNDAKNCCFMGKIAEVRVSNTALTADKLLRPLPAGPVDADTLVYLPMGDCDWFGASSTTSYKNIYYGILNAAPTAVWTPHWLFNSSSSVSYPAVADDAIEGKMRNGYLATTDYDDDKSVQFSRALVSGQYQGHVVQIPYEDKGLTGGSFTMEWFFKTDGQIPSGNTINSYTFLYPTFAKIMINQADGRLLTRLVATDWQDYNSPARVDDAKWHHYALVYDKQQQAFAVYLDYRKINSGTFELTTSTSRQFCFGGVGCEEQAFAGQLDDFRITKRALKASEFLTTRKLVSRDALFAHFEGDLATGQDAVYAPAGEGGTLGGGTAPTFVDVNRRIDFDGDGKADYTSTKALRLDGGSVVYPHNSLLESRNFTAEWFAKYDSLADATMLMRFGMASTNGTGAICWAFYTSGSNLRLGVHVSPDGSWESMQRQDKDLAAIAEAGIADGSWHHWAIVAQTNTDATPANTTFKLYRDCEQVGSTLVFDNRGSGGILAFPSTGTTLSIGTGGNRLKGTIDELRVTPSVLAPERFMHRFPNGFSIEFR